ncbi:MAG: 4a-hydroxytetrahydrobiopterin dehydratase [Flavobacterium sp.]|nr:4a-hydroxytetrahydrobiopterin dehydratase [Flavobacterium sp.]
MSIMNEFAIQKELASLTNWIYVNNSIEKDFIFENFTEALDFINKVGALAEKMNHHPEINNVYNKVKLRLTTHDAKGITQKDFDLALAVYLIS